MAILNAPLVESIDGEPLVTKISEFVVDFPYDRLPTDNALLAFFLQPKNVVASVLFYLASEPLLQSFTQQYGITGKSSIFRMAVAAHNLALAIFSLLVAINAFQVFSSHYQQYGWNATYCDQDGSFWASGNGTWAIIFYLSKYWEFIDTWILVLKGKKPSFLQLYHHAGIVLTMWGGVVTQAPWLSIVVMLNSTIHTFMYTYFFIKTISPKTEIRAARYLTTLQILQFFTGIGSTLKMHVMGDECVSAPSRLVLACLQLYGVGLIVLFMAFASRKYKKA